MSAQELLIEITRYDARLVRTADGLKVQAPEPLPGDLMDRLRAHKAELLRLLPAEAEKTGRVLHTAYGKGYVHADGRIADGQPEPMPMPAMGWPDDLTQLLRRVSTYFEWSPADRRDFVAWARRSAEGIHDAREFLMAEVAKLPAPGLSDRRRVVLGMLAADASINYAWTCGDDGSDPVTLTLAIRAVGTVELAIPRAKFDAFALPGLMADLAAKQEGTA